MDKLTPGDVVEIIESSYEPYLGERATVLAETTDSRGLAYEVDLPAPAPEHLPDGSLKVYARGPIGCGVIYYRRALRRIDGDYDGLRRGSWDEVPWRPSVLEEQCS